MAKEKKTRGKQTPANDGNASWRTRTWVGLTVIVSIWMFILGILAGRGTISFQYNPRKTTEALNAEASQADHAAGKTAPAAPATRKKNPRAVAPEPRKTNAPGKKKPAPVIKRKPAASPEKRAKTAGKVKDKSGAAAKAPVAHPDRKDKPKKKSPPPPSPPVTHIKKSRPHAYQTIQVAAMKSLTDAKRMVIRLRKKGYPAYLASAATPGKGMTHRVRVGPYKSTADANRALGRLKKSGITGLLLRSK